jgi:hypothetical protein
MKLSINQLRKIISEEVRRISEADINASAYGLGDHNGPFGSQEDIDIPDPIVVNIDLSHSDPIRADVFSGLQNSEPNPGRTLRGRVLDNVKAILDTYGINIDIYLIENDGQMAQLSMEFETEADLQDWLRGGARNAGIWPHMFEIVG